MIQPESELMIQTRMETEAQDGEENDGMKRESGADDPAGEWADDPD